MFIYQNTPQSKNDETTLQQTQHISLCLGFYGRFGKDCTISQGVQRDIRPKYVYRLGHLYYLLALWAEVEYQTSRGRHQKLASTSSSAARHVCIVSSACFAFLSRSKGYELRIDMAFGILSGKSALYDIIVGSAGIHCQGQCYRCHLQRLCFGAYRYCCHAVADGAFHRRYADGRRARRGSAATAAQSATTAHTRTAAKPFVEKNSGQIHTSDRAFRPTYNIAYRLRELLRRFRPPNILVGIAYCFRSYHHCGGMPFFRCLHHTPAYHQAIAFFTRRYHHDNVLRV